MSNTVDFRVIAIGVVALVLALQEQSRTSWVSLTETLARGAAVSTPCVLPAIPPYLDYQAAMKTPETTGSIHRTVGRTCP